MRGATEKELDKALEDAFKSDAAFCSWFLGRTKFAGMEARYAWSRSDHPWGRFELPLVNPDTGVTEFVQREGETDVLVVFQTDEGYRLGLHVENKIATGKFTEFQPELYAVRAEAWVKNLKYGNYDDYETILVTPRIFYEKNRRDAMKFGKYISHEEISAYLPVFRR